MKKLPNHPENSFRVAEIAKPCSLVSGSQMCLYFIRIFPGFIRVFRSMKCGFNLFADTPKGIFLQFFLDYNWKNI
jgi:hypothetical protein